MPSRLGRFRPTCTAESTHVTIGIAARPTGAEITGGRTPYIAAESYMADEQTPFNQDAFNPTASPTDLYYCYRLILGRNPDPGGWSGLSQELRDAPVGVDTLVFNFLRSPEFQTRRTHYPEPAKSMDPVAVEGFELYVAPEDWDVGAAIARDHTYEPHVSAAITKRLGEGMVFLDIGANIGYFSMLAARLVGPTGQVFSFEASQKNAILIFLSSRRNHFHNVQLFPFALANSRGTWLYDSHGSNGNLVPFTGDLAVTPGRTLVYAMTLDDLLSGQNRVDVIKIDIEGAEYMALEGGRELLGRCRPVIFSEFSPVALQHISGKSGREYLDLLQSLGYEFSLLSSAGDEIPVGVDSQRVLDAFHERQSTHIDIVATPRPE